MCIFDDGGNITHVKSKITLQEGKEDFSPPMIDNCVKCRRYEARGISSAPLALPEDREQDTLAFEVISVDLAAPLIICDGYKALIIHFTCFYRAVHL
ncbi:hypothetical protein PR048_013715 [Dryococelus australis]|uniref:Uncharacterized protein n=1 Tax=Dryococelus australis TaxID=614101 RepID=A0ABQ9HTS3_9NEOP|nr:hypothetical protein PR048_013715 [Dryococelus australis]